jgi:hypothetical protein
MMRINIILLNIIKALIIFFPLSKCILRNREKKEEERKCTIEYSNRNNPTFISHADVFGPALEWIFSHGSSNTVVIIHVEDIICYAEFPEWF